MKQNTETCPLCEAEVLHPGTGKCNFVVNSTIEDVVNDLEFYECENCGAQIIEPDQAERNHLKFEAVRKAHPEKKGKFE